MTRRRLRSFVRGYGPLVAVLFAARPALAQPAEEEAARSLFREGTALHESHDYAAAIEKYRAAYARWKNPKILTNIGSAAWELGRFPEAAAAYDQFLADAPAGDPNRAEVEKALRDVLPKVGTLDVRLSEGSAAVTVDGQYVEGPRFDRVRVNPGTHTVEAVRGGGARAKQVVEVSAGATVTVSLVLEAAGPADAPEPAPATGKIEATTARPPPSALPWIVGGIGVAGLATSGVAFAMRSSAVNDLQGQCIDAVCAGSSGSTIDRANLLGVVSAVALGVGVVGVGGAVFLLTRPHAGASQGSTTLHLGVAPGPTWASAVARVRF